MDQQQLKQLVAKKAVQFITEDCVLGVGSGSTVSLFIKELLSVKDKIKAVVAASIESENSLKVLGFEIVDANSIAKIDIYIDGADEITPEGFMIKGGGAALTREKILLAMAKKFICIVDNSKKVEVLGSSFALPIEVIPMARSFVAREIVELGGQPEYREGVITDNGNVILDIYDFRIKDPKATEQKINNIAGVVTNGIFALRGADKALIASKEGIEEIDFL